MPVFTSGWRNYSAMWKVEIQMASTRSVITVVIVGFIIVIGGVALYSAHSEPTTTVESRSESAMSPTASNAKVPVPQQTPQRSSTTLPGAPIPATQSDDETIAEKFARLPPAAQRISSDVSVDRLPKQSARSADKALLDASLEIESNFYVDGQLSQQALSNAMSDEAFVATIDALAAIESVNPEGLTHSRRLTSDLARQLQRAGTEGAIYRLNCGDRLCATVIRLMNPDAPFRDNGLPGMSYRTTLPDGSSEVRVIFERPPQPAPPSSG